MKRITIFIIILLASIFSLADIDEFKGTTWVGSAEYEKDIVLVISEQLHWSYSFTNVEDGVQQEVSGAEVVEDTLFGGEQRSDNPLVLILIKNGELAVPPLAIVRKDYEVQLIYDDLTLTKKVEETTAP